MFIKSELTKDQKLRRKEKTIKGKSTKEKFTNHMLDINESLKVIKAFEPNISSNILDKLSNVIQEIHDTNLTTSSKVKLYELMALDEDLKILIEDMKLLNMPSLQEDRLVKILTFIEDYNHVAYEAHMTFYEGKNDTIEQKLKAILKAMRYKRAKMQYDIEQQVKELSYQEKQTVTLASSASTMKKESFEYQELTQNIMQADQRMQMLKGRIGLLRKSFKSVSFLNDLFEQLSLLSEYTKALKKNGPTLKLIKKLYKNPEEIEVLDTTLDLTSLMETIKAEIKEVEAVVNPAKRMVLNDTQAAINDDLISKYQAMGEGEGQ